MTRLALTRRNLMKILGAAGFGTAIAATVRTDRPVLAAAPPVEGSGFAGKVIPPTGAPHVPATIVNGQIVQPQRTVPMMHETDVLVVGGGSAGVMAAIAAKRAGAKVAILERYGYFGGLWTGGMVLVVIGTHVKDGN
jgi:threonine dehydrogenase-like Zn-dependent dehydrogenase